MIGAGHPKTRLIVNADDFGRTREVCDGVARAFRDGLATSTTLVANGPAFEYAVNVARTLPGLAIGVHLTIDEYAPLSPHGEIRSLLRADGTFHPRARNLLRIIQGKADPRHVLREWTAQVDKVRSTGLRISHVDGHGHCHVCPRLADVVSTLLERFDIRAARLPAEPLRHFGGGVLRHVEKVLLYAASAHAGRSWTMARNDYFMGFSEGGRLTPAHMHRILSRLRPGVTELMTHPSTSDEDIFGLSYGWRGDLESLLLCTKAEAASRYGVQFITYHDLAGNP
ncbi:MAG TPA: ChbG/HpnK family deacetylase [Candidatus Polarisedimenticolaceae bacterium]|nr:ChbG/HpnK family deacetylase [Candidatus Polarisedimenticolaceae bacterium]